MKIYFGFSAPKSWKPFAEFIKWGEGTPYDHAYTRFQSDSWGLSFIYQSSGLASNFMGNEYFESINNVIEEYCIEVPDYIGAAIGRICVNREGTPYGIAQILGAVIAKLALYTLKRKIKNPLSRGIAKTDCIEEQSILLSKGLGINIPLDMDTADVKDWHDFLVTLPGIVRVR